LAYDTILCSEYFPRQQRSAPRELQRTIQRVFHKLFHINHRCNNLYLTKTVFDELPRPTELPHIDNKPHCSDVPCEPPELCSELLTSVEAMEESCA
jgi:hypothetical protein